MFLHHGPSSFFSPPNVTLLFTFKKFIFYFAWSNSYIRINVRLIKNLWILNEPFDVFSSLVAFYVLSVREILFSSIVKTSVPEFFRYVCISVPLDFRPTETFFLIIINCTRRSWWTVGWTVWYLFYFSCIFVLSD